ncbi:hypothetical protein DXG03_005055 [Asterophora parasitica]|uniref:Uncharacterized protein n=1 Tax=Asterophora parasitica TaxID=117018 RepID=A0A9P7G9D1_9AGAR|nr:hypothetical protein DXG03_005055 [Asterophora parasitica]
MNRLIQGRESDAHTLVATNLLQLLIRQDSNRYKSGNLVDVCLDFLGSKNVRELSMDEKNNQFRALEKHLDKLLINTVTTGKRTKTIRGLVPYAGRFKFSKGDKDTTVQDYFKDAHNRVLQFPTIIGVRLNSKAAPPNIVPLEICTVLPGQLYRKRIPDHLTKAMVDFATSRPDDRLKQIVSGNAGMESPVLGYANSEALVEAGMIIDTKPLTIKGKILDTPSLWYGSPRPVKPRDGAWNLRGQTLNDARPLACWAVINFCPGTYRAQQCEGAMQALVNVCGTLGMRTSRPVAVITGMGNAVENALNEVLQRAIQENFKKDDLMVIAILPAKAPVLRLRIKHWGDIVKGLSLDPSRPIKIHLKALAL